MVAAAITLALAQLGLLLGGIGFYRLRRRRWQAALRPGSVQPPADDVIYATPQELGLGKGYSAHDMGFSRGYSRFGRAPKPDFPVPLPRGGT